MGLEEALYLSLVVGFGVGFAASMRGVSSSRYVDGVSTASILGLVFSMGLIVGVEVSSLRGLVGAVLAATLLLSALPGLAGSIIGQAVVRALEGRAKGGG